MFTLGRKIDIHYKTNKIIIIASLIVSALGYFITKDIKASLYLGAGTFITWALTREIDPKHEYSAFLSAGIYLINLFYFTEIGLLNFLWILLLIRLVTEITGKEITIIDILTVFGLTLFLTISNKNSIYIIPFVLGILLIIKYKPKSNINLGFLILSVLIYIVESFFLKYFYINTLDFKNIFLIISLSIPIIYIYIKKYISIDGLLNDKGEPANKNKVRHSQNLFAVTILIMVIFTKISFSSLVVYIAVILGIIIYSSVVGLLRLNK